MRFLAYVVLVVTGLFALGSLLLFIDLVVTGLTTGAFYRYVGMAEALALFVATAFMASRARRFMRAPRLSNPPVE
jgi:hypothetical protein